MPITHKIEYKYCEEDGIANIIISLSNSGISDSRVL